MRSTSMWVRVAAYLALGGLGVLWTAFARDTLLSAPDSSLRLPPRWDIGIGAGLTLATTWLVVRATRAWVLHTRWAFHLHLHMRSLLLGTTPSQMVLLAGLAACSEELLFRAALGSSIGFVNSCAVFALVHVGPRQSYPQRAAWTFATGLMLSGLYLASGNLLAPIVAHWLINYENMQYICNYDPTPLHIDSDSGRDAPGVDR